MYFIVSFTEIINLGIFFNINYYFIVAGFIFTKKNNGTNLNSTDNNCFLLFLTIFPE